MRENFSFPASPGAREPVTLLTGSTEGYLPVVLSYRGAKQLRGADSDPFNVYKRMMGLAGMDQGTIDQVMAKLEAAMQSGR